MSDQMHAEYRKQKLTGLLSRCPAVEIDRPWVAAENMGPLLAKWERAKLLSGRIGPMLLRGTERLRFNDTS
jgi:hypothetical protein